MEDSVPMRVVATPKNSVHPLNQLTASASEIVLAHGLLRVSEASPAIKAQLDVRMRWITTAANPAFELSAQV
jgi:hypothetical protein